MYRISSYSFRGNYSFLNLEIQRSQYIGPKVTVHKGAETIQGRKLFKGGNYMRKYGILDYNIVAEIDRLDFPVGLIGINQSSYAVKFLTRIEGREARGV